MLASASYQLIQVSPPAERNNLLREAADYLISQQVEAGVWLVRNKTLPIISRFLIQASLSLNEKRYRQAAIKLGNYIIERYSEGSKWSDKIKVKDFPYLLEVTSMYYSTSNDNTAKKLVETGVRKLLKILYDPELTDELFMESDAVYSTVSFLTVAVDRTGGIDASKSLFLVLDEAVRKQSDDGSWGKGEEGIYKTSKMVQTLMLAMGKVKNEKYMDSLNRGVNWLVSKRTPAGGWGSANFYTGIVLDTLLEFNYRYSALPKNFFDEVASDLYHHRSPTGYWGFTQKIPETTLQISLFYLEAFKQTLNKSYLEIAYEGFKFVESEWKRNKWMGSFDSIPMIGMKIMLLNMEEEKIHSKLHERVSKTLEVVGEGINFLMSKTPLETSNFTMELETINDLRQKSVEEMVKGERKQSLSYIADALLKANSLNETIAQTLEAVKLQAETKLKQIQYLINLTSISKEKRKTLNDTYEKLINALKIDNYTLFFNVGVELLRFMAEQGLSLEQQKLLKTIKELYLTLENITSEINLASKEGLYVDEAKKRLENINSSLKEAELLVYENRSDKAKELINQSQNLINFSKEFLSESRLIFDELIKTKNNLSWIEKEILDLRNKSVDMEDLVLAFNEASRLFSQANASYFTGDLNQTKTLIKMIKMNMQGILLEIEEIKLGKPSEQGVPFTWIFLAVASILIPSLLLLFRKKLITLGEKKEIKRKVKGKVEEELGIDILIPESLKLKSEELGREVRPSEKIFREAKISLVGELDLSKERARVKGFIKSITDIAKQINLKETSDEINELKRQIEKIKEEIDKLNLFLRREMPPSEKKLYTLKVKELDDELRKLTQMMLLKQIEVLIGTKTREMINDVRKMLYE